MKSPSTSASGWSRARLETLVSAIDRIYGFDLSQFDEGFVKASLGRRLTATQTLNDDDYSSLVTNDHAEAEALIASLGVHHSAFFRDPLAFALLEQRILPLLLANLEFSGRKELRVWSAGCAAGQEAYSVAILLKQLGDGRECTVPFRIFATDCCEEQLAVARAGEYAAVNLCNVRLAHFERWFARQGQIYVTAPELRAAVDFSVYDLFDTHSVCPPVCIYGEFDLVLCCNVLFYYRQEGRRLILNKLRRCLAPGGYLMTGETERELPAGTGFRALAPSVTVFRTTSARKEA